MWASIMGFVKAIPAMRDMMKMVSGWFDRFQTWRKQRKFEKKRRKLDEAMTKAKKENNTEDLQKELEDLL